MLGILAMIPPPIMLLILIAIAIVLIIAIPKLKNSRGVDKLADGLFSAPKEHTVDEAIDVIKSNKQTLKNKSVENEKTVKNVAAEQEKINKNI